MNPKWRFFGLNISPNSISSYISTKRETLIIRTVPISMHSDCEIGSDVYLVYLAHHDPMIFGIISRQ